MGDFNTVTKQKRVDFRPSSLNDNQQPTTNKRISIKGCSVLSMVRRDVSWIETFKLLWLWRSAPFLLGKIKSNFQVPKKKLCNTSTRREIKFLRFREEHANFYTIKVVYWDKTKTTWATTKKYTQFHQQFLILSPIPIPDWLIFCSGKLTLYDKK